MEVEIQQLQHLRLNTESYETSSWSYAVRNALPKGKPMEGQEVIVAVRVEDTDRVLDFLRKFFFKDEPLNVAVQLLGETGTDTCEDLEKYSTTCIPEGLSLMAVTSTGEIVGVCLNGAHCPNDNPVFTSEDPKFSKILRLLNHIDKQADVFGKYPGINKIIETKVLSVDGAYRKRGIAKRLMTRTRELARENGFPLYRVDCTSHFSALAVEKLGMQCIYELKYEEYTVNDQPVFEPGSPHKVAKTFVQLLQ